MKNLSNTLLRHFVSVATIKISNVGNVFIVETSNVVNVSIFEISNVNNIFVVETSNVDLRQGSCLLVDIILSLCKNNESSKVKTKTMKNSKYVALLDL